MAEDIVDIFKMVRLSESSIAPMEVEEPVKGPGEEIIDYHDIMTEEFEANDTRIAMIGNVDSGKSTLIGVLTNRTLDDGRGGARALVLKHRHEQENGRTSAVTVEIMGYKGAEQVLPTARNHAQRLTEVNHCFYTPHNPSYLTSCLFRLWRKVIIV
jgi:GTPase